MLPTRSIFPLPFRRFKLYANGLYDEENKRFYPFKPVGASATSTMVAAVPGMMPFVHTATVSVYNEGDHAAGGCTISGTRDRISAWLGRVTAPSTTLASGVNSNASAFAQINSFFDVNTAITVSISGTGGGAIVVFCLVPADDFPDMEAKKDD